jgi:hypothetical protein
VRSWYQGWDSSRDFTEQWTKQLPSCLLLVSESPTQIQTYFLLLFQKCPLFFLIHFLSLCEEDGTDLPVSASWVAEIRGGSHHAQAQRWFWRIPHPTAFCCQHQPQLGESVLHSQKGSWGTQQSTHLNTSPTHVHT